MQTSEFLCEFYQFHIDQWLQTQGISRVNILFPKFFPLAGPIFNSFPAMAAPASCMLFPQRMCFHEELDNRPAQHHNLSSNLSIQVIKTSVTLIQLVHHNTKLWIVGLWIFNFYLYMQHISIIFVSIFSNVLPSFKSYEHQCTGRALRFSYEQCSSLKCAHAFQL